MLLGDVSHFGFELLGVVFFFFLFFERVSGSEVGT